MQHNEFDAKVKIFFAFNTEVFINEVYSSKRFTTIHKQNNESMYYTVITKTLEHCCEKVRYVKY